MLMKDKRKGTFFRFHLFFRFSDTLKISRVSLPLPCLLYLLFVFYFTNILIISHLNNFTSFAIINITNYILGF